MHKPVFSVITPVYNGEEFIRETVLSVLKYSKGHEVEYIVINDGSNDSTSEILKGFQGEIILIEKVNSGEAASINLGLSLARGTYSLVVSADDPLFTADLFTESKLILDCKENIVATYPDWRMIDGKGKVLGQKITNEYSRKKLVCEFNCLPGPGAVFRTSHALAVNGRDPEFKFVSDYDFWLRLSNLGDFQRIPKELAQWRSHTNSTSLSNRGLLMANERIAVINKFVNAFPLSRKEARISMAHAYYNAAILAYFDRNVPGRKLMIKAIWLNHGWVKPSKFRIVAFLLLLPLSRIMLKLLIAIGAKIKK